MAGAYATGFGPMTCQVDGAGLACCYGGTACDKQVTLTLDAEGAAAIGAWSYATGQTGPVRFGVSDECDLTSGVWAYEGQEPRAGWGITGRR